MTDIEHALQMLTRYRKNLQHLLDQESAHDSTAIPTKLTTDIEATRHKILDLKTQLRAAGLTIGDHINDEEGKQEMREVSLKLPKSHTILVIPAKDLYLIARVLSANGISMSDFIV